MDLSLVKGLSGALLSQTRGPHRHIITVTSRAQLRRHIKSLKKGEKLVVVFSTPGCGACKHYYKTYFKYNYVDRGRHKFLWAKGSFVRTFTRRYPTVCIATSSGRMFTIPRYSVLQRLGVLSSRPRIIYRPLPRRPIKPLRPRLPRLKWRHRPPRPRFVAPPPPPTPRPVAKPMPPKPWTSPKPPRPNQPKKSAALPGVFRFYPFGKGLFSIEVRTKFASTKPAGAVSRPAPRPAAKDDSGGDDDMVF